jgi:hypothetical protein
VNGEIRIVIRDATPQVPLLCVIDPDATLEEIVALVAVISAQAPATPTRAVRPSSEWPVTSLLGTGAQLRPRSWRASILPTNA